VRFRESSADVVKPEKIPESFWEKGNNALNEVDSALEEIGEACRDLRNIAVGENEHLAFAMEEFQKQQNGLNRNFHASVQQLRKAHQAALGAVSQAHGEKFIWTPRPPRTPQPVRTKKIYPDIGPSDYSSLDDKDEDTSALRKVRKFNNAVKIAKKTQAIVRREFHIARIQLESADG
jgi:hypothetical protein